MKEKRKRRSTERATPLLAPHHAPIAAAQNGDTRVSASIGPSGEVIALWSAAADAKAVTSTTTQPGWATFPTPRAARPVTARVTVHSPTLSNVITIHDFPLAHPAVQPLPDDRVLAVGTRARWRQDGPDRNAIIYSADGTALTAQTLGDGIEHVFTTSTGHVWVGYFDEGVYGNYGWGDTDDREPIGSCGLARFSPDLKADWRFPSNVNNPWGAISDCYALNVDADTDTAWTCYYTGFPIVGIHQGALTGRHGDGTAARALITDGSRIALYGGHGTDRDRLVAGQLTDDRMQSTRHYRLALPDGRKLPGDARVIGRGTDLHILTSHDWYRLDLGDIPAEP